MQFLNLKEILEIKPKCLYSIYSHDQAADAVDVTATIHISSPYTTTDVKVHAMVHYDAALMSFSASRYDLCTEVSITPQDDNFVYRFSCTCRYGLCEHVVFAFRSLLSHAIEIVLYELQIA